MAYYGPNAEIMGSVKLQIWHHKYVIEAFGAFATNILILFAVDFLSFVINGLMIWKFCGINSLRLLSNIQKRYWFIMIFSEAYLLGEVSWSWFTLTSQVGNCNIEHIHWFQNFFLLMLGGGNDLTQEFDWIDGRYQTNSNLCNWRWLKHLLVHKGPNLQSSQLNNVPAPCTQII